LVNISRCDVFFDRFDSFDELVLGKRILPGPKCKICARFSFSDLARKVTDLPPFTGLVMENEEFGIDTEGKAAIVVDRPTCSAGREAVIGRQGGGLFFQSIIKSEGIRKVATDDFGWPCSDD